jgi:hypothetical protein
LFPSGIGPLDGDRGGLDILQLESHVRVELVGCVVVNRKRKIEKKRKHDKWTNEYEQLPSVGTLSPFDYHPFWVTGSFIQKVYYDAIILGKKKNDDVYDARHRMFTRVKHNTIDKPYSIL